MLVITLCSLGVLATALASCGGDDADETSSDAEWVSAFCQAALRLGDATSDITPPPGGPSVSSEMLQAMAPAFQRFADDIDALAPPRGFEDYHREFAEAAQETADLLKKGDLTVDAFRPMERLELPAGFEQRLAPVAAADDDCKRAGITFDDGTPAVTATPGPGGSGFAPPAIDYSNPGKFLEPGPQSTLSERSIQALRTEVMPAPGTGAARIYAWMARTFTTRSAGGGTIGITNVNQLIETRVLTGCHDWAMVMTAALRYFGYPALMVDTAGLQWAEDYAAGKTRSFAGHVFAEVLTNDGWMLVDCTSGKYTLDYDPENPAIAYTGAGDAKGFYALYKGIDPAAYGLTSNEALQQRMKQFAEALPGLDVVLPAYQWQQFP